MRIEFDRDTCIGMFQCVAEWEEGFEKDMDAGKAVLKDGEETEEDVFSEKCPRTRNWTRSSRRGRAPSTPSRCTTTTASS